MDSASVPPQRRGPPRMGDRERFLAFAFTAAELLLEVTPDGQISFAIGAFESRLGSTANAWIGRPVQDLLAARDRPAFNAAFRQLLARGRLPPTEFSLANTGGTMAISGLRVAAAGAPDRICISCAAMPVAPAPACPVPATSLQQAAEARLRDGASARLGLFELAGPQGLLAPAADIASRISAALTAASDDGIAGELGAGRYGMLSGTAQDLTGIADRIEALLRDNGITASVTARALDLADHALTPLQATRALRHALASFTQGGDAALANSGFGEGLSGFVAAAYARGTVIRRIISERRFQLAYQPIVSLADRATHHFEALLRPQAAGGPQPLNTQDLVTTAEILGLSEELDWAVVETVIQTARGSRGAPIACNLSGLSLQSAEFRRKILTALQADPALAERLLVEITETADITQEEEAVTTANALRACGVPLCIDDFGAGAASFRYLRLFRVDYMKIDGSYVANAAKSEQDRGLLSAMVDLGRTVGARVVAERIETEAESALMRELGVQFGQGWLFGRPGALPAVSLLD